MTAELPTGDLTFLMTDIVDSTAWWDLDPVNMAEAVRRHEAIVGRTVAAHGGAVARSHGEGDSTLSAFERAADAVMAAVATQHALRSEEWPGAIGLRTRMGLHSGPADLRDGHYYGTTVNETARVRDLAEPAQVLVSSLTAARAARSLPTAYRLRELGPRRLRGVGRGVVVHEVVHEVLEPGDDGRSATVAPRPGAGPAVVGRARELAVAEAAIEHARATGGGLVLVAGEAGIGKTSLCHALTVRARAVGTVVAWGHSSPDDRRPSLWPWRQALRSWADQADPRVVDEARRAGGPTAVRLLLEPQADHGTDGHEPAAAGDRDERDAAFRGATRLLATAAAHEPLVLVLDDLQWADLATLALVEVLLPPEAATGVVLVATMRREARPRAGAAADALDRILALGATTVVELAGLEAGALRRCIHAIEPDPLGDDVIDRIVEQSGGNPLFATELARWAARAGPDSGLPRTITDVIRARVADLPGDGRRLLAAGSVLGRAWTAPEVAELTGLGVPTARRRLDDAVGAGLVVADGRDRRRFAHRLISEVVGQDLADAERTRLHRAALAALVRAGAPDADAADAARHATAVALADPAAVPAAVARLRRAALVADRSLAHDEAAQHLEQALALDDGSLDPRERYQLLMDLGTTYDRDGQVARAQETLGRAAALAQARGWAPELAAAAVARARVRRFDVDVVDDTGAEPLLAAAWDLLPDDDRSTRARVAAERPCRRPATPEDVEETVRWSATAIDLAQRADDQVALSRALRSA
ncbi:MAG: AAA family ATPase, partial [Acidimicrobiales bacterium]|nr:AAA family ATPase [Acidimicrobiales bacterium]